MVANKISHSLYGDKVKIDFYPDSHRYKMADKKTYEVSVTAATGILDKSRFLISWAVNLDFAYLRQYLEKGNQFTLAELAPILEEAQKQHIIKKEEAADIGTQVHDWIELFIKSKIRNEKSTVGIPLDEKVQNGITGFLDWYNSHKVQFLASERLIYSVQYEYCGITDFTAIVDGKHVVGDFKTGKGIYTDHFYQISAYWNAVEEEDKKKFDEAIILHVNKETGAFDAKIITKEENNLNFPIFLACLAIKKREKELSIW